MTEPAPLETAGTVDRPRRADRLRERGRGRARRAPRRCDPRHALPRAPRARGPRPHRASGTRAGCAASRCRRTTRWRSLLPAGGAGRSSSASQVDGRDVVVPIRDVSARAARRPRLEALAALGAAIQRERSEAADPRRASATDSRELGLAVHPHARRGGVRPGRVGARRRPRWRPRSTRRSAARCAATRAPGAPSRARLGGRGRVLRRLGRRGLAVFVGEPAEPGRAPARSRSASRARSRVRLDERTAVRCYLVARRATGCDRGDVAAVRLFGAQVAAALDAARTIADLSRRNAELAALNRLGALAGDAADLPRFFARAAGLLRDAAGCAGLAIYVLDDRAGELVLRLHRGAQERGAHVARVLALRRRSETSCAIAPRGWSRPARIAPDALVASLGFAASAWVPLVARSRAVGVMPRATATAGSARASTCSRRARRTSPAPSSRTGCSAICAAASESSRSSTTSRSPRRSSIPCSCSTRRSAACARRSRRAARPFLRDGDRLLLVSGVGPRVGGGARLPRSSRSARGSPGSRCSASRRWTAATAGERGRRGRRFAPRAATARSSPSRLLAKAHALGALVLARPAGAAPSRPTRSASSRRSACSSAWRSRTRACSRTSAGGSRTSRRCTRSRCGSSATPPGDVQALLDDGCREVARGPLRRGGAVVLARRPTGPHAARGVAGFGAPFDPARLRLSARAGRARRGRLPAPRPGLDRGRHTRSAERVCAAAPGTPPARDAGACRSPRAQATRGVLFVADDPGRTFARPELALANALAGELAVGLENAELYAEARRRVEELSLLNEMGRTVAASLDLDQVLREGVEAARRLLRASRGRVVLYDPVAASCAWRRRRAIAPEELASSAALGEPAASRCGRSASGGAVVVEDVAADPR